MEAPDGWNALTAALSVCRLHDLPRTWAFLSLQGLVDDQYDQRAEQLARLQPLLQPPEKRPWWRIF